MPTLMALTAGVLGLLTRGQRGGRLLRTIHRKLVWNGLIRTLILSYLPLSLFMALHLVSGAWLDWSLGWAVAHLACVLLLAGLLLVPGLVLRVLDVPLATLRSAPFRAKFGTLYSHLAFSAQKPYSPIYYPVFLTRRLLFAFALVLFAAHPRFQLGSLCVLNLLHFLYLLLFVAHHEPVSAFLSLFSDLMLFLAFLALSFFLFPPTLLSPDSSKLFGWVVALLLALTLIGNILLFVPN